MRGIKMYYLDFIKQAEELEGKRVRVDLHDLQTGTGWRHVEGTLKISKRYHKNRPLGKDIYIKRLVVLHGKRKTFVFHFTKNKMYNVETIEEL